VRLSDTDSPPNYQAPLLVKTSNTPLPASYVVSASEADRTILLDISHGRYYGLNDVAGRAWFLLCEGASLPMIVSRLADEFEVSRSVVEHDLAELLVALKEHGLLQLQQDASADQ